MGREMTRAPRASSQRGPAIRDVGWVPGTDAAARRASCSQPYRGGSEDARLRLPQGRCPGKRALAPRQSHPKPGERAPPPGREPRPAPTGKLPPGPARVSPRTSSLEPQPPARRPLPSCRCRREARTPRGRRRGPRAKRWSSGRVGGAARRAVAAAARRRPARPRPPCRRGTPPGPRKCGCSGRSPCWRRRGGHAGGQPRSGQQTARPAPRGRRGRRVIAAWAGGGGERGSRVRKCGRPFYRGAGAAAAALGRGRWGGRRAAAAPPNMPFLRREPPAASLTSPRSPGRAALPGNFGGGDLRSPNPGAGESAPRERRRPERGAARPPGEVRSPPRPPPPPRARSPRRSACWAAAPQRNAPGPSAGGREGWPRRSCR